MRTSPRAPLATRWLAALRRAHLPTRRTCRSRATASTTAASTRKLRPRARPLCAAARGVLRSAVLSWRAALTEARCTRLAQVPAPGAAVPRIPSLPAAPRPGAVQGARPLATPLGLPQVDCAGAAYNYKRAAMQKMRSLAPLAPATKLRLIKTCIRCLSHEGWPAGGAA